jgi:hypothetical protein
VFVLGVGAHFVVGQVGASRPAAASGASQAAAETARLMTFVDKNGGYTDKAGGYYDPKAGTYTDKVGGVVDNWQGYTYNNGDYKARTGDFWEAATKTFKLSNGEVMKSPETSNKDAIAVLRQTVEENGGYDKDYMRKGMLAAIAKEHPAVTAKTDTATDVEIARLMKFVDKNGGYRDSYGGYYDPNANTYTDEKGGVLDKWGGYTYTDGSYKSKFGDYWDAPTKAFKLASGEVVKSPETSNADAITVMRQSVEENGGYDKDFLKKAMLGQIARDHPAGPR